MLSLVEAATKCLQVEPPNSSPRISFSADDNNFISICPKERERERDRERNADFEFLSGDMITSMIAADEVFSQGKMLPLWQVQQIALKAQDTNNINEDRSWLIDDDPSPRPPKCTVLWKELLRLKKQQRPSSEATHHRNKGSGSRDDNNINKVVKKGLERTRPANIRIRPIINVPICTAAKNTVLTPLFPPRRGRGRSEG